VSALTDAEAALGLLPDSAFAHANRAMALWELGRKEEGAAVLDRTVSCGDLDFDAAVEIAEWLSARNDRPRAIQWSRVAVRLASGENKPAAEHRLTDLQSDAQPRKDHPAAAPPAAAASAVSADFKVAEAKGGGGGGGGGGGFSLLAGIRAQRIAPAAGDKRKAPSSSAAADGAVEPPPAKVPRAEGADGGGGGGGCESKAAAVVPAVRWPTLRVLEWLRAIGSQYEQYAGNFAGAGIDGPTLLQLTDSHLASGPLGVAEPVHRMRILNGIAALRKEVTPVAPPAAASASASAADSGDVVMSSN
jgi:hypothetical protein